MKASGEFLAFVQEKFDSHDGKILVEAISQEKQLWKWLIASHSFRAYFDCFGGDLKNWKPSKLAMFSVLQDEYPELNNPQEMCQKYNELTHAYESLTGGISSSLKQQNVPTAVKIAYLIRYQFETEKNFQFLSFLSLRTTSAEHGELSKIWSLVFAILDGILTDASSVYTSILRNLPTRNGLSLICHAILTQPASVMSYQNRFSKLFGALPIDVVQPMISELYHQNKNELARTLAETILPDINNVTAVLGKVDDEIPFEQLMNFALTQHQNAKNMLLRDHRLKAVRCLTDTQLMMQRITKGIQYEIIRCGGHSETAMITDGELATVEFFKWDHLLSIKTETELLEWEDNNGQANQHILFWVKKIQIAMEGGESVNVDPAIDQLHKALNLETVNFSTVRINAQFNLEDVMFQFINQLIEHMYQSVAFEIGQKLIEMCGASNRIFSSLFEAAYQNEAYDFAMIFGQWLVIADPENMQVRRMMGMIAVRENQWDDAMGHFRTVLEKNVDVCRSDWASMADAALQTSEYGVALESGRKMLELDAKDADAHIILGKAYLALKAFDEAAHHFDAATELDSQATGAWLGMVDLYTKLGDPERIEGLLLKALSNNPADRELMTALATHYYTQAIHEKAKEYLENLVDQIPADIRPAELYVKLLWELEDLNNLEIQFEKNEDVWINSKEIAFYRGMLYSFKHQYDAAIPLLHGAVAQANGNAEKIRALIHAILQQEGNLLFTTADKMGSNYPILVETVQLGLDRIGNDFEFLLLRAQIALYGNELDLASEILQQLGKYYEANLPMWKWQIQAGLGLIALREAQVNQAMAAFQSAQAANPEEIRISIWLAEATWMAQLEPQALLIADQVCSQANGSVDILEWYINFIRSCGENSLARKKLAQFIRENPRQHRLRFKAIELALENNDHEAMHEQMAFLLDSQKLDQSGYRKLAHYFEVENQFDTARSLLEKVYTLDSKPNTATVVELYRLSMLEQNFEKAIENIVTSGLENECLFLAVLKVDALIFLERYQEAELQLIDMVEQPGKWIRQEQDQTRMLDVNFELSRDEYLFHQSPAGIYLRLALVYRMLGNFAGAIASAEKALAFARENPIARYYTVMMMQVGQDEKRLIQLPRIFKMWFETGSVKQTALNQPEKIFQVHTQLLDLEGQYTADKRVIWERMRAKLKGELAVSARGKVLEARIRYSEADYQASYENYQASLKIAAGREAGFTSSMGFYSIFRLLEPDDLWFVWGALGCGQYKKAWTEIEKYYHSHADELGAVYAVCKAGLHLLETEIFYLELGITDHLPSQVIDVQKVAHLIKDLINFEGMEQYPDFQKRLELVIKGLGSEEDVLFQLPAAEIKNNEMISYMILSRRMGNLVKIEDILPRTDLEDRKCLQQLALMFLSRDPEQGLFYAKRALGISPGDPVSRVIYGMLAQNAKDYFGALHSIEAALQVWTDEWQWREWAVEVARLAGDDEANLRHTMVLHQGRPGDIEISLDLVSAYLQVGAYAKALSLLDKAGDFEKEFYFTRLSALYVIAYYQSHDFDQASAYLPNLNCEDPISQRALLIGAELFYQQKAFDSALHYAQKAYAYNPKHPATLLWLAKILKAEGHSSDALTMLRQIGAESSQEIVAEQLLMIRELAGDSDFHQELDSAMSRYRHHPQLLYMKAVECEAQGKLKDAVQYIKQALKEDSSHPDYHELAGNLSQGVGQLDQAIYHFSEAIRYNLTKVELYLALAKVHILRRESSKALDVYRQGILNVDEDFRLYYESALIMRENKKYQDAEVMFRKALALQPVNEEIRNQLGAVMALNFVHNSQEARR